MVITNYAPIVLAIIGAIAFFGLWTSKFEGRKGKKKKNAFLFIAGLVVVYGLVGTFSQMGYLDLGSNAGFFLTTTGVSTQTGVNIPVQTQDGVKSRVLDTLSVKPIKEKYANSYTTVSGTLKIYDSGTDPSSATANPIETVSINSGTGTSTNKTVSTNIPYRMVFDGGGTYYDKDLGIRTISESEYNPSTGTGSVDVGEVVTIATIGQFFQSVPTSNTSINGQTTLTLGTDEIGNSSGTLVYDISVGDGQFYFKPILESSGANKALKDAVMCFEWDTTNPPEGDELSALTQQLVSGTDFSIPSDLLNYWSNELCVNLGSEITGGISSEIKITATVTEANLGANDDWYFAMDDLGSLRGKDVRLNTGATINRLKFDAQA